MTCVAYSAGVIAADSMSVADDFVKHLDSIKVAKRKGHLFGIAGDLYDLDEVIKWYFSKDRKPIKHYEFDLLVITPSGSIHQYDHKGRGDLIQGPFYSIGTGREFAIGALAAGASAEEAVQVAINWSPTCSGKVIVRKL